MKKEHFSLFMGGMLVSMGGFTALGIFLPQRADILIGIAFFALGGLYVKD